MATADRLDLDAIRFDGDTLINGVRRPTGPLTEEEFLAWRDEDVKAEWVDGEVIIMSPSSVRDVRLIQWLTVVMVNFVEERDLGEMLGPEFLIRLVGRRRRRMLRVPDLLFVAKERAAVVKETYLDGPPDLAIEVVSPDSETRDRQDKRRDYQAAKVREYWIVDPLERALDVLILGPDGRYRRAIAEGGRVGSAVLPGFFLRPEWLWQSPLPAKRGVLAELGLPG